VTVQMMCAYGSPQGATESGKRTQVNKISASSVEHFDLNTHNSWMLYFDVEAQVKT
jgi:hypothetical protein